MHTPRQLDVNCSLNLVASVPEVFIFHWSLGLFFPLNLGPVGSVPPPLEEMEE